MANSTELLTLATRHYEAGRLAEAEAGYASINVADEGPGFTDDDRAKMFRRYARLSARPTGGEPSTGLGLSIVKKLTEAMHGKLSVDSAPGGGAVFTVRLPQTER